MVLLPLMDSMKLTGERQRFATALGVMLPVSLVSFLRLYLAGQSMPQSLVSGRARAQSASRSPRPQPASSSAPGSGAYSPSSASTRALSQGLSFFIVSPYAMAPSVSSRILSRRGADW